MQSLTTSSGDGGAWTTVLVSSLLLAGGRVVSVRAETKALTSIAASGDTGQGLIAPDRVGIPDGIAIMEALIDELAEVPLPAGAVIGLGDVHPDRASQTGVQIIHSR